MSHIRRVLPSLSSDISRLLHEKSAELERLRESADPALRDRLLIEGLHDYTDLLSAAINPAANSAGTALESATLKQAIKTSSGGLHGGSMIEAIFTESLAEAIEAMHVYDHLDVAEMHALVRNLSGLGGRIFVPDATFRMLVVQHIAEYESVCQQCVDLVQVRSTAMRQPCDTYVTGT